MSGRPFRFGLTGFGRTKAEWQDFARKAEDLGYSSIVIPDHFGLGFSPMPALLGAAAATTRLRLGTFVYAVDFRHPAVVAKEAATADVMTDGRIELGIGAGWMPADYTKTGIPFDSGAVRVDRLDEAARIIKALLSGGEPVAFHGKHYQIEALDAAPKCVQQPRLPILMGASSPKMLALAGREADIISVQAKPVVGRNPALNAETADGFTKQLAVIREAAGPRYADIEINVLAGAWVTDDRNAQADDIAGQMHLTREDVLGMPALYIGSPDAIVEQLLERRERFGITYPVVFGNNIDAFAPVVARLAGR